MIDRPQSSALMSLYRFHGSPVCGIHSENRVIDTGKSRGLLNCSFDARLCAEVHPLGAALLDLSNFIMESLHVLAPSYSYVRRIGVQVKKAAQVRVATIVANILGRFSVASALTLPIQSVLSATKTAARKQPIVTSSHSRTVGARTIRIAAAVIRDDGGRLLLVRKRGTSTFMQAGGKIDPGELPAVALARELREELGVVVDPAAALHLGSFSAPAANERNARVEAELFELAITGEPVPAAEIEEMIWLSPELASGMELAPLTADIVLPRYCRQP